jgi:hypothetical protein
MAGVGKKVRFFAAQRRKGVDDAADRRLLELERGLVDHQARADVHDALDLDQVVGLERVAGGDQVDDGIGQPVSGASSMLP